MISEKIDKILNELFMLEPELKKQADEIKRIAFLMIEEKPEVDLNKDFLIELKQRLSLIMVNKEKPAFVKFFWPSLAFVSTGIMAVALIVVVNTNNNYTSPTKQVNKQQLLFSFNPEIKKVPDGLFGKINGAGNGQAKAPVGKSATASNVYAAGTESVAPAKVEPLMVADSKMGGILPPYYGTDYQFTYKGGDIKLPETKQAVYKKSIKNLANSDLALNLQGFNFGFVDLSKFDQTQLSDFSFKQEKPFGYIVSVNLQDSYFSIYQNWKQWTNPFDKCGSDDKCYEEQKLKTSDMINEEEIVNIAQSFVKQYGFDVSSYGEPEVVASLMQAVTDYKNGKADYAPESVSVVFPLLVSGQVVYNESGALEGMNVDVSLRFKKVTGTWGNFALNLDQSGYEMETDLQKILKAAKNGGRNNYHFEAEKKVEVELGDPKMILAKIYNYDTVTFESSELFVPALSFPVINKPEGYYQKEVIVPLVKGLLDEQTNQPMPMAK